MTTTRKRYTDEDLYSAIERFNAYCAVQSAEIALSAHAFAKTLAGLDSGDALRDAIKAAHREAYYTIAFADKSLRTSNPMKQNFCMVFAGNCATWAIEALESAFDTAQGIDTDEGKITLRACAAALKLLQTAQNTLKSYVEDNLEIVYSEFTQQQYEAFDSKLPEMDGLSNVLEKLRKDHAPALKLPLSLHPKFVRLICLGKTQAIDYNLAMLAMRSQEGYSEESCLYCRRPLTFAEKQRCDGLCNRCY